MGMTGMRARARSIGGELTLGNGAPTGLSIAVSLPFTPVPAHEVKV